MRGTNGSASIYPFRGRNQEVSRIFRGNRQDRPSVLWASLLTLAAAAAGAALVRSGSYLPEWWIVLGLALVAGVAERQSVALLGDRKRGIEISVSFLPFVFTAVAFGPLAAFAVGALSNLADFRPPYLRWAVYTPGRALTGAAMGLVAGWLSTADNWTFSEILVASLGAALTCLAVDTVINMT